MAFLLLIISYIGLYLLFSSVSIGNKRENILKASITFSLLTWGLTELTSSFGQFNYKSLIIGWSIISLLIGGSIFKIFKGKSSTSFLNFSELGKPKYNQLEKLVVYFLVFIVLALFVQGLLYPPNNWDSLSYHMARISYWVSNESIAHFSAHDHRQIHQPPLAEYLIAHFCILSKSDLLANSVQLVFLVLTAITNTLIVRELGLKRFYQLLAAFFTLTIPEVIIQASSTKNDIIVSFFVLLTLLLVIRYLHRKKDHLQLAFAIGCTAGLALLTKATAYLFIFPILLFWGIYLIRGTITNKTFGPLKMGIFAASLMLLLNATFFQRNYELSGNILGMANLQSTGYSNDSMSFGLLASNITRNLALHVAPFPLSYLSNGATKKFHEVFQLDINNPNTTYPNTKFKVTNYPNGEGDAPNVLNFLLGVMAFMYLLYRRKEWSANKWWMGLIALITIQFLLFCLYLRWQPWHTRLHITMFIIACPLLAFFFKEKIQSKLLQQLIILGFATYAMGIMLINTPRPIVSIPNLTSDISIVDKRYKKFFVAKPALYEDYESIRSFISQKQPKVIINLNGLIHEYPLFDNIFKEGFKVFNPPNVGYIKMPVNRFMPDEADLIISSKEKGKTISFNGKAYSKIDLGESSLSVYQPN